MKRYLDNMQREAERIRLSSAEKARMREAVFGMPAEELRPRPSPYVRVSFSLPQRVFAGVLAIFLVGAGTASAAEGALPGDWLYPVKINVNEQVELALAQGSQQKVAVEALLASRRVQEAQTLAAEGRLDATTTDEIVQNFNAHAEVALALAHEHKLSRAAAASTTANSGGEHEGQTKTFGLRVSSVSTEAPSTGTSTLATTTIENEQQGGEDDNEESLSASLEAQKQILQQLRLRSLERGGEVKGSESEHSNGGRGHGNGNNNDNGGD